MINFVLHNLQNVERYSHTACKTILGTLMPKWKKTFTPLGWYCIVRHAIFCALCMCMGLRMNECVPVNVHAHLSSKLRFNAQNEKIQWYSGKQLKKLQTVSILNQIYYKSDNPSLECTWLCNSWVSFIKYHCFNEMYYKSNNTLIECMFCTISTRVSIIEQYHYGHEYI